MVCSWLWHHGFRFARMLRASPLTERTRLIAMAPHLANDEVRAMAAGFDGLVSKPIQRGELLEAIRSVLAQDS
jgi:CheY-like chemotaxis protein